MATYSSFAGFGLKNNTVVSNRYLAIICKSSDFTSKPSTANAGSFTIAAGDRAEYFVIGSVSEFAGSIKQGDTYEVDGNTRPENYNFELAVTLNNDLTLDDASELLDYSATMLIVDRKSFLALTGATESTAVLTAVSGTLTAPLIVDMCSVQLNESNFVEGKIKQSKLTFQKGKMTSPSDGAFGNVTITIAAT